MYAREVLRGAGYESELFVEMHDEGLGGEVHHYSELDRFCRRGRTALIYQLAIGSKVADALAGRAEPLIVNYHNLTPPAFFGTWDPGLVDGIVWGLRQLHQLVPRTSHAIAVSGFNERDLVMAGYHSTAVVPPFVDVAAFANGSRPSSPATHATRTKGARWLFVGRLAPNKAAHHIVMALAAYRRAYDSDASLTLVGGHGHRLYTKAVEDLIEALGLGCAVELKGSVTHEELAGAYAGADVFVCLSDHEGFCFPILEAMHHDLPVVAFAAGAIPETVGSGGLVLQDKSPAEVAAAVHRVLSRADARERLADAGRRRLTHFDPLRTRVRFLEEVGRGLERAGLNRGGAS